MAKRNKAAWATSHGIGTGGPLFFYEDLLAGVEEILAVLWDVFGLSGLELDTVESGLGKLVVWLFIIILNSGIGVGFRIKEGGG